MALAFHPQTPSLLAIGTFTGDVMLWKLADVQPVLVSCSSMSAVSHQEPISHMEWSSSDKTKLFTTAYDGKILIWDYQRLDVPHSMYP